MVDKSCFVVCYLLTLFVAKTRSICLPVDLEALVNVMLSNNSVNALARANLNYKSSTRSTRPTGSNNPWDYKNIIEKLQVCVQKLYETNKIKFFIV